MTTPTVRHFDDEGNERFFDHQGHELMLMADVMTDAEERRDRTRTFVRGMYVGAAVAMVAVAVTLWALNEDPTPPSGFTLQPGESFQIEIGPVAPAAPAKTPEEDTRQEF